MQNSALNQEGDEFVEKLQKLLDQKVKNEEHLSDEEIKKILTERVKQIVGKVFFSIAVVSIYEADSIYIRDYAAVTISPSQGMPISFSSKAPIYEEQP